MNRSLSRTLSQAVLLMFAVVLFRPVAVAQGPKLASWRASSSLDPLPSPPIAVTTFYTPAPERHASAHSFWDRPNCALFSAVAASSAADFYVTHANLAAGGRELNPVTRMFGKSSSGLAVNFSAETASVIGISYLFHRSGHHRLERLTTVVNISSSGSAVAYDWAHR